MSRTEINQEFSQDLSQEREPNNDFYSLNESFDDQHFLQFIALIVSDFFVEAFEADKRLWTFHVMQRDNEIMKVEIVSTCPEDELRLHRLYKSVGSIIYSSNAYIRKYDNVIVIENDPELMMLAMHPTLNQLKRFVKELIDNEIHEYCI